MVTTSRPAYEVKTSKRYSGEQLERAREGVFTVFGHEMVLAPPARWDWDGEVPSSSQAQTHAWVFLDPLLQMARDGDRAAFDRAHLLALDWLRANPQDGSGLSRYAWADKIVGDRASYLGYLTRLGIHEGWLEDPDPLLDAMVTHGRWLADGANYGAGYNHGLHQDAGLAQLAKYAGPIVEEAAGWKALAVERFRRTLEGVVDADEGVYLEHSVGYQFNVALLVDRFIKRNDVDDQRLRELGRRIDEACRWFCHPDGRMAQIGDTDLKPASVNPVDGLGFFPRSGWCAVRQGDSYLVTSACYFSNVHKHADELSFELSEGGRRVVVDTGLWAYETGHPSRAHALSAEAHNGLTIGGGGGQSFRGHSPYGSGMLSARQADGWYVIAAHNPLLDVDHRRAFLYRPGVALIVLDRVDRANTRRFHLAPTVTYRDGVLEGAGHLELTGDVRVERSWVSPGAHREVPVDVVMAESGGGTDLAVFSFGDRVSAEAGVESVTVTVNGHPTVIPV